MLKAETKTKLKALGFDVDKMVAAVSHAEEQDFALPELLTQAEIEARDTNNKKQADGDGFKRGKDAGIEIATKAVAKKFGIELTDASNVDELNTALSTTVTKGDEGLKERNTLLLADKKKAEDLLKAEQDKYKKLEFDTQLLTNFPAGRNSDLTDSERLMLLKNSVEFVEEEGVMVAKKDGKIIRDDKTQSPIAIKDAIAQVFTERKWVSEQSDETTGGGRGAGDNLNKQLSTAGIKTMTQAQEAFKKAYPDKGLMSNEFSAFISEVSAKGDAKDFDYNA